MATDTEVRASVSTLSGHKPTTAGYTTQAAVIAAEPYRRLRAITMNTSAGRTNQGNHNSTSVTPSSAQRSAALSGSSR